MRVGMKTRLRTVRLREAVIKGSLDDRMRQVRAAVCDRFDEKTASVPGGYPKSAWVQSVFEDSVVFEFDGKLWQLPYTMDGATVKLDEGDPSEVRTTYVPVAEALRESWVIGPVSDNGQLLEAKAEITGRQWGIVIIQEGMSKNRNRYGRKVLEAAAPMYEGARIYADHQESERRFGRSVNDCIGFLKDVKPVMLGAKEAAGQGGTFALAATAVITKEAWQRELKEAYEAGKPDLYGFSHDVKASAITAMEQATGRAFYDVQVIEGVDSVDLVTNPAAGGRVVRLVASNTPATTLQGDERMLTKMIEAIRKSGRTDLIAKLEALGATPTEDQVLGLYEGLMAAQPAQPAAAQATREAVTTPAPAAQPTQVTEAVTPQRMAIVEAQLLEARRAGLRHFLAAGLAECSLPEAVRADIRAEFDPMIAAPALALTEADITGRIRRQVELFGKLAEGGIVLPGPGARPAAQVIKDKSEKFQEALNEFFGVKVEGTKEKPVYKTVEPDGMRSFRGLYVDFTGDRNITGRVSEAVRLSEALTTASFDQILGDSITRRMVAEYNGSVNLQTWRGTIARTVPVNDFRTQRRMRMGGYGNLTTVAQGAPYPSLTSPTDEEATYAPAKRGGTEQLTIEMIANDDVGAIRRIPTKLARAAGQTLHEFVWDFLRLNSNVYDGTALAAAGHGNNISTTALSATQVQTARLRMKNQGDMSNSKRIGLVPRYLIGPNDLEDLIYQIVGADRAIPDSSLSAQAAPAAPNPVQRYSLQPIIVEYWTDANDWWMAASLDQSDMIEVGFLNGREDPELFVQDQATAGSMFSNDVITYKIRHIYGGAVVDFRPFFGGIVP